ncbi:MAG: tetratricopeptide repeat protein [Phycisphaerales bacterium JB037]
MGTRARQSGRERAAGGRATGGGVGAGRGGADAGRGASGDWAVRVVIVAAGLVGIVVAGWTFVKTPGAPAEDFDGSGRSFERERGGTGGSRLGPRLEFAGTRLPETIPELEERVRSNPARVEAWIRLGDLRAQAGDGEGARGAYQRAVTMIEQAIPGLMGTDEQPRLAYAWYWLGLAHLGLGEEESARTAFGQASAVQEGVVESSREGGAWYNLACFRARAGDAEGAIAALERSVRGRRGWSDAEWARRDPDLELIRGDPRFEAALENVRENRLLIINP